MAANDNLTGGLGDLYRKKRRRRPERPERKRPVRRRPGRHMALDPFHVITLVLLGCAVLLQIFLIAWLEII